MYRIQVIMGDESVVEFNVPTQTDVAAFETVAEAANLIWILSEENSPLEPTQPKNYKDMRSRLLSAYAVACTLYFAHLAKSGWNEGDRDPDLMEAKGRKQGAGEMARMHPDVDWEDLIEISDRIRTAIWRDTHNG